MDRREFVQISSLSLSVLLTQRCSGSKYAIEFNNDMAAGHLAFEPYKFPITQKLQTEYLIVGGGMAGMSAAYQLRNRDFMLFELSNLIGGSSSGSSHGNIPICHGAHYDLSYPSNYGEEALQMLEELNIIQYDQFSDSWKFVDKKYLIPKIKESQTFAEGVYRKDVLPDEESKPAFVELMNSFTGKMPMPTRLIRNELRELDTISFLSWLREKLAVSDKFIEGIDYHMKDDYGGCAAQVSALAGIHYFACRPYYTEPVELFSPPEGNFHFINKLRNALPANQIRTSHMVKMIREHDDRFKVEVVDVKNREITIVNCHKIIYAGHKHALKYIFPSDFSKFIEIKYAPWVVVNIVLDSTWEGDPYWQNEMLSQDKSLLGFVDSKAQFSVKHEKRVFTIYYCFKPEEREMMSLIETRKNSFVDQTIKYLEGYFNRSIKHKIEKVFIKQMGHAMPIPIPGYLFKDANNGRSNSNLVYAGVDNGRLPLLFEAIDSGIVACNLLE